MDMEQFRKDLESDAKKENGVLKKQNEKLKAEQTNETLKLRHDLKCMANRCYIFTGGCMCGHCRMTSNFKCDYLPKEGSTPNG